MNINQIRYVLETAASSSMRAAATKLYVSQPALSSSIHELEEELGIVIFERTNIGRFRNAVRRYRDLTGPCVDQIEGGGPPYHWVYHKKRKLFVGLRGGICEETVGL